MINKIIFEDQIILYWDKEWDLPNDLTYVTKLNGKNYLSSSKTHVEINDLAPDTIYTVTIDRVMADGTTESIYNEQLKNTNCKLLKTIADLPKKSFIAKRNQKTRIGMK